MTRAFASMHATTHLKRGHIESVLTILKIFFKSVLFMNNHSPSSSSIVKGLPRFKGVRLGTTVLSFFFFFFLSVFLSETTFASLVSICLCGVVTFMVVVIASGSVVGCIGGPVQRFKSNTTSFKLIPYSIRIQN